MDLTAHRGEHLRLFADCVPVKGVKRSAIYDLTRSELHLFPTEYFHLLQWLITTPVDVLVQEIASATASGSHQSSPHLQEFLDFLVDNELMMTTPDPSRFPPLDTEWDYPGEVQSAIIDVDSELHEFQRILKQLDALGCQFLQLRGFSPLLTLDICRPLLQCAMNTSIASVELVLRYNPDVSDETLTRFMRDQPLVTSLTVHAAPEHARLSVPMGDPTVGQPTTERHVVFTPQVIDSAMHCGLITQGYLSQPTVPLYTELREFNGCLNRKISVDAEGNIRNCPSMGNSFGSARSIDLGEVVKREDFRALWKMSKDRIDVCSGCEFRYVCTDCRAYLERPEDLASKPLKCGYDPATATWEAWYRPTFKAAVSASYGFPAKPTTIGQP